MASAVLEDLRRDIEAFKGELNEEFYQNYAGLKDEMHAGAIYGKYAHLFSGAAVNGVRKAYDDGAQEDDPRCLRYLSAFTTLGYLDNAVKDLTDRSVMFESQSAVKVEGGSIPYREVLVRLRNEPDRRKREGLFEAKLDETRKFNEILYERMTSLHRESLALGFKCYGHLCAALKGIDYRALEAEMEEMLRRTEGLYLRTMDELLERRAGVRLQEAWSYDVPYAFRGEEFDRFFLKDRLVEAFLSTLKGMGIDPDGYSNILIDTEDRPKKTPRAFCATVKVPDDVRLVIRPTGGWRDYDALFHEGGHAWHFGNTSREHPAEFRYLGDNSVTEAFAFLFNYLPSNPVWLERVLGMDDPDPYVRFTLVNKLMFLRRYAAKLVYEMKLHHGTLSKEFGDVYKNSLQRALRFKHPEAHYLEDVDDELYCADYLRAWMFEGQLRRALEGEFGEAWFQEERAGKYLKELWSYGQKYDAGELIKTVGYVDLDAEPVISEIERGLA